MKRQFMACALAVVLAALCVPALWAQMAQVKGFVHDREGKPIVGAVLHFVNKENGRKFQVKTDKKGEYYSLGLTSGTYNITVNGPDGQQLYQMGNVRLNLGEDNIVNVDLQKEAARAVQEMSPEQKKAIEEQQKEAAKVKGLNEMLATASSQQQAGQYDAAVTTLQQAAALDASRDLIWFKLADAERLAASKTLESGPQKEKYAKAVEDYKKAIAIKPVGAYYNNLGEALVKAGDVPGAVAAYNQAAQIDPTNAGQYYFNEGAVLTNTGKVDEAVAAFDKAIQADPNKADAYYWKGVDMMGKAKLVGNKMEAPPGTAEAFNKYLELAPEGQFAGPAKEMLGTIGAQIETSYGKQKTKKK